MRELILIAHNLRSSHNVGSLLRTADGVGVETFYLSGYTPYPAGPGDTRLPHLSQKINRQIAKTALGAEKYVNWKHANDILKLIAELKRRGFTVAALEQAVGATPLPVFASPPRLAIIVGREVKGLEPEILQACDCILEIPMFGQKESFNVVQAAAMALYHCRFTGN